MPGVHEFSAVTLKGEVVSLDQFSGKVLVVVNTASQCGFTPQYKGLDALHRQYAPRGFSVLGFPCNQFGGQEPGTSEQIGEFCAKTYDVTFPMFARVDVNGPKAHPLYRYLSKAKTGLLGSDWIKWNFTKFLVGRDGLAIARYAPQATPESMARDIEKQLGK